MVTEETSNGWLTPAQKAERNVHQAAKGKDVWIRLTTENTSNWGVESKVEAIFYYQDEYGFHELLKLHSQPMDEKQMNAVKNDFTGFLMKVINRAFSEVTFLFLALFLLSSCSPGVSYKKENATIVNNYQNNDGWHTTVRLDDGRRETEKGNLGEKGDQLVVWVWE